MTDSTGNARDQLFEFLHSASGHTSTTLATLFRTACYQRAELSEVDDETLLAYCKDYNAKFGFDTGDASCTGEWHAALEALQRYTAAYPDQRVGQAVAIITAAYWGANDPINMDFAGTVALLLDSKISYRLKECFCLRILTHLKTALHDAHWAIEHGAADAEWFQNREALFSSIWNQYRVPAHPVLEAEITKVAQTLVGESKAPALVAAVIR